MFGCIDMYGDILACSDDDATEMKRVQRMGGTFTMRRERREKREREKNINRSPYMHRILS